jgi:enamine deaminase RidA (YjgF/YER057c/UK114 family)
MTPDQRFLQIATRLGFEPAAEIKIGGNYTALLRCDDDVFVSGQIPRIGEQIAVVGAVGTEVSLAEAQRAAQISAVRALALLQRELGSLERVRQILRVTVYVRSAADFTHHSEVADGASNLLHEVLGAAGRHTRNSVGVLQLPKGAAVEIDLQARVVSVTMP